MSFIEINGIEVESRILTTKFACDYGVCRGGCCYASVPGESLNGGALSAYDAAEILLRRRELAPMCDPDVTDIVKETPVTKDMDCFYTTLCGDKCVLVSMTRGECALKTSQREGVTDIGIPLSCQLYPLLWEVGEQCDRLVIGDVFGDLCNCGYERGEREGIYIIDFLKDAIIRGFGEEFYSELKKAQKNVL